MDGDCPFVLWQSYLSGDYSFGGINPPWQRAGLPKNGCSPSPEDGHQPQRVVSNLNTDLQAEICFGQENFAGEIFWSNSWTITCILSPGAHVMYIGLYSCLMSSLGAHPFTSTVQLHNQSGTRQRHQNLSPNFFEICVETDQQTYLSLDASLPKHKSFLKKWYCYFHSMSVFVKCLGLKIVLKLS